MIPRTSQTDKITMDKRTCRWGCLGHTIEHRADENSSKVGLLPKVQLVWDIWSVGVLGPRLLLRVRDRKSVV